MGVKSPNREISENWGSFSTSGRSLFQPEYSSEYITWRQGAAHTNVGMHSYMSMIQGHLVGARENVCSECLTSYPSNPSIHPSISSHLPAAHLSSNLPPLNGFILWSSGNVQVFLLQLPSLGLRCWKLTLLLSLVLLPLTIYSTDDLQDLLCCAVHHLMLVACWNSQTYGCPWCNGTCCICDSYQWFSF